VSAHNAVLEWSVRPGEDFLAGRYSRGHLVRFDEGVTLPASASPSVVRAPWSVEAAADPEEMLVASIASCHMLWFLDFAKHAGVKVARYRDEPVGRMGKMPSGRIGVVDCVLRPQVEATLADGSVPAPTLMAELHHKAHDACNIANSVLTIVRVEPAYLALQGEPAHG
jgi:organic hydroperoxide reductase OsmC/OhrA